MKFFTASAMALFFATPALAQDGATPTPEPNPGAESAQPPVPAPSPGAETADDSADASMAPIEVTMTGQDGMEHGTVTLTPTPNGVLLNAMLTGLPDGGHGFHFHQTGVCEGDFSSAGGHHNPTGKEHGYQVEGGPHAGDMPNFVAVNGEVAFDIFNPRVMTTGGEAPLNDADGTALIIHGQPDDYESQPSGDAGDRIACGVVFPAP